jgi:hypothetical protein
MVIHFRNISCYIFRYNSMAIHCTDTFPVVLSIQLRTETSRDFVSCVEAFKEAGIMNSERYNQRNTTYASYNCKVYFHVYIYVCVYVHSPVDSLDHDGYMMVLRNLISAGGILSPSIR